ncbi:hypothetical protein JCM6882_005239 [Rhodosporidiobolus microsporus]
MRDIDKAPTAYDEDVGIAYFLSRPQAAVAPSAAAPVKPKILSMEEVAKHNSPESLWVVIDGKVWDISKIYKHHPGGQHVLDHFAGKDATKLVKKVHRPETVDKFLTEEKLMGLVDVGDNKMADAKSEKS